MLINNIDNLFGKNKNSNLVFIDKNNLKSKKLYESLGYKVNSILLILSGYYRDYLNSENDRVKISFAKDIDMEKLNAFRYRHFSKLLLRNGIDKEKINQEFVKIRSTSKNSLFLLYKNRSGEILAAMHLKESESNKSLIEIQEIYMEDIEEKDILLRNFFEIAHRWIEEKGRAQFYYEYKNKSNIPLNILLNIGFKTTGYFYEKNNLKIVSCVI